MPPLTSYTIRPATPADAPVLERLARLNRKQPLDGRVLVAEADGAPVAALSLDEQRSIADPTASTAVALVLLRTRAGALAAAEYTTALCERVRAGVAVPLAAPQLP